MEDVEEWEETIGSSSSDYIYIRDENDGADYIYVRDENDGADYSYIQFGQFWGLMRLPKTSTPYHNEDEDVDDEIINDEKEKESVVSYKPTTNYSSTESDTGSEAPHNGDALPDQPNVEPDNSPEAENGEPQAKEP